MIIFTTKKSRFKIVIFILTSFSCSFSCSFTLFLFCYAWLFISFFLSNIANNAVFLAFSFKSFKSAFKTFVFANLDCCQLSHHLLVLKYLCYYKEFYAFCQEFSQILCNICKKNYQIVAILCYNFT